MIALLCLLAGDAQPGDVTLTLADGRQTLIRSPIGTYWLAPGARPGRWVIHVGAGESPTPGPGPIPPGPGPAPIPTPPGPSPFGISRFVFDRVSVLSGPAKARAQPMSQAFRDLADAIPALSVLAISSTTKRSFTAAAGDQVTAWRPVEQALTKELKRLAGEGRIVDKATLAAAYREIAAGLGAVR